MRGNDVIRQLIYTPLMPALKNHITGKNEEAVESKEIMTVIDTVGNFIKVLTDLCCVSESIECIVYNSDDIINYSKTVDWQSFNLLGYNDDCIPNIHWKRIKLNDPDTWKKYADLPLVKSIRLILKDGRESEMNTGIRYIDEYGEDAAFEILTRNMDDYDD